jgi:tyrosinase
MAVYSKPRGLLPLLFTFVLFLQATVAIQHGHHHHHHNVPRTPEAMAGHLQDIGHLLEEGMHNLFGAASNQGANQGGSNKGASNQGGSIAITGIQGTVAQRLEIRDLAKNTDQWNLYLLGMERFMAKAKTDPLSFYQVAGM